MDTQEFQIRARKISQLDNYDKDITQYGDNSYVIIGYNDGDNKQNYKMNLTQLSQLASGIDDDTLISKINNFINNGDVQIDSSYINELNELRNQINSIQNEIIRYHESYPITYYLNNVSLDNTDVYGIKYGENLTLYFTPSKGYKMPPVINVTGCEYEYSQANKLLHIYNPTKSVVISINGQNEHYSLSLDFTNITYEYRNIEDEQNSYTLGDSINLLLTANSSDSYVLPESLTYENCLCSYTILDEARTSAVLTIICNGEGDMSVSGEAINMSKYYFGFVTDLASENMINIEYIKSDDNIIKGINLFELNSLDNLTYRTTCPYDINTVIEVTNIPWGGESFMIVPAKYVLIDDEQRITKFKIDNSTEEYKLYSYDFQVAPQPVYINYLIDIDGIPHYAIWLGNSIFDGFKLIIK